MTLPVPGTANGRLAKAEADVWRFRAKKGERLVVEVQARRLGSPLDSSIEILDAQGKPVPRAVLRGTAKTYTTFRDHDSASPGIRIEAWSELAVNDYLLVGDELVRIRELPRNPDDDCQFFSVGAPAHRLPGDDADLPPAGRADVQGVDPPARLDLPAQRPAAGHALLPQRRRRPRPGQGLAPRLRPAGRRRLPGPPPRRRGPRRPAVRLPPHRPPAAPPASPSVSARRPRR